MKIGDGGDIDADRLEAVEGNRLSYIRPLKLDHLSRDGSSGRPLPVASFAVVGLLRSEDHIELSHLTHQS